MEKNTLILEFKVIKNILPLISNTELLTFSLAQLMNDPKILLFDINMQQYKSSSLTVKKLSVKLTCFIPSPQWFDNLSFLESLIIRKAIENILFQIYKNLVQNLPKELCSFMNYRETLTVIQQYRNTNQKIISQHTIKTFVFDFSNITIMLKPYITDHVFYTIFLNIFCNKKSTFCLNNTDKALQSIILNIYFNQIDVFAQKLYFQSFSIFCNKKKIRLERLIQSALVLASFKTLSLKNQIFNKYLKTKKFTRQYVRFFNQIFFLTNEITVFINRIKNKLAYFLKELGLYGKNRLIFYNDLLFFGGFVLKKNQCSISLSKIKSIFYKYGLVNKFSTVVSYLKILNILSIDIIAWYSFFIKGFLKYYNKVQNFNCFKNHLISYCKRSLLTTLSKKHQKIIKVLTLKFKQTSTINIIKDTHFNIKHNVSYIYSFKFDF